MVGNDSDVQRSGQRHQYEFQSVAVGETLLRLTVASSSRIVRRCELLGATASAVGTDDAMPPAPLRRLPVGGAMERRQGRRTPRPVRGAAVVYHGAAAAAARR